MKFDQARAIHQNNQTLGNNPSLGVLLFMGFWLTFWTFGVSFILKGLLAPKLDTTMILFAFTHGGAQLGVSYFFAKQSALPQELQFIDFSKDLDGFSVKTAKVSLFKRLLSLLGTGLLTAIGILLSFLIFGAIEPEIPRSILIGSPLLFFVGCFYLYLISIPLRALFKSKDLSIQADSKKVLLHSKSLLGDSEQKLKPEELSIESPENYKKADLFLELKTPTSTFLIRKSKALIDAQEALNALKDLSQDIEIGDVSDRPKELEKLVKKGNAQSP